MRRLYLQKDPSNRDDQDWGEWKWHGDDPWPREDKWSRDWSKDWSRPWDWGWDWGRKKDWEEESSSSWQPRRGRSGTPLQEGNGRSPSRSTSRSRSATPLEKGRSRSRGRSTSADFSRSPSRSRSFSRSCSRAPLVWRVKPIPEEREKEEKENEENKEEKKPTLEEGNSNGISSTPTLAEEKAVATSSTPTLAEGQVSKNATLAKVKKGKVMIDFHNVLETNGIIKPYNSQALLKLIEQGWEVLICTWCYQKRAMEVRDHLSTQTWWNKIYFMWTDKRVNHPRSKAGLCKEYKCTALFDDSTDILQDAFQEGIEIYPIIAGPWNRHGWYNPKGEAKGPWTTLHEAVEDFLADHK
eukprot:Skav212925  [mRNA]  locus=scaffold374:295094:296155:- [translate_table: standard]